MSLGLIVPIVFPILFPGVLVAPFLIWMLFDCWTHPRLSLGGRLGWTLAMFLTFGMASLFYFWTARPGRFTVENNPTPQNLLARP